MPKGLQCFVRRDVEAARVELDIPEHCVFHSVVELSFQTKDLSFVILETLLNKICAQIIFATFLFQLAKLFNPMKSITIQSETKRKYNSYRLTSPIVSTIAEGLEQSELATNDDAYATVIPVLHVGGTLPTSTDSVLFHSILQNIKKHEADRLHDEARDLGLWLSHQIEITSKSYRSRKAWSDAGHIYLHYYSACRTYGSSPWIQDAARRMGGFEGFTCDLEDAELTQLLRSKEWIQVKLTQELQPWFQPQHPLHSSFSIDSTSLWKAVAEKDAVVVARIIRAGSVEVDTRDSNGRTPLIEASKQGLDSIVELLITGNAAFDAQDNDGQTSLHHAVQNQHQGVLELLLLCEGVPLFEPDFAGQTPLSFALKLGDTVTVTMLNFYDIYDVGKSHALFDAAKNGNQIDPKA